MKINTLLLRITMSFMLFMGMAGLSYGDTNTDAGDENIENLSLSDESQLEESHCFGITSVWRCQNTLGCRWSNGANMCVGMDPAPADCRTISGQWRCNNTVGCRWSNGANMCVAMGVGDCSLATTPWHCRNTVGCRWSNGANMCVRMNQ